MRDWRQIGLGIFGLADALIKMGIRYGGKESLMLCDSIGQAMAKESIYTSAELAFKNIKTYPKYNSDAIAKSDFFKEHAFIREQELVSKFGLYNSQLLTIAPTGTLSTMLGVSGGIEPIYANYYTRKTESLHGHDEYYKVYTPIVKKYMDEHYLKDDSGLPDYFVTAQALDYKQRIDMQAVWQQHIDASISSTVNVPNSFTVDQVKDLYMYAWEKGLKGVTIFRDGCKRSGILSTEEAKPTTAVESKEMSRGYIIKVDDNTIGKERHLNTGCGTLHCCAYFDPVTGELLETYLSKGSKGGCLSNLVALSRLISLAARGGVDVYSIADQLESTPTCPSYAVRTATKHDTSKGSCCPTSIGYAVLDMYEEMQSELFEIEDRKPISELPQKKIPLLQEKIQELPQKVILELPQKKLPKCPQCGDELLFEGGCNICKSCGWSKCD